jgi:hypothetical protein
MRMRIVFDLDFELTVAAPQKKSGRPDRGANIDP